MKKMFLKVCLLKVFKVCMSLKPHILFSVIWIRFFSILRVFLKSRNVMGNYFNVFSPKLLDSGVVVASLNQILQKLIRC